MATIDRRAYAEIFGPTVGDRVRLADTDLIAEVDLDGVREAGYPTATIVTVMNTKALKRKGVVVAPVLNYGIAAGAPIITVDTE